MTSCMECVLRRSFLMFLIAPTVILFIQIMVTTWRYTWLVTLIMEMVYVVIFWYVGKLFKTPA